MSRISKIEALEAVDILIYLSSNNDLILKSGFGVVQDH